MKKCNVHTYQLTTFLRKPHFLSMKKIFAKTQGFSKLFAVFGKTPPLNSESLPPFWRMGPDENIRKQRQGQELSWKHVFWKHVESDFAKGVFFFMFSMCLSMSWWNPEKDASKTHFFTLRVASMKGTETFRATVQHHVLPHGNLKT